MTNAVSDPEAEFQNELRVFDNDVDEVIQCFYIWRTVHAAARKSRRVYDLLNRNEILGRGARFHSGKFSDRFGANL